MVLKRSRVKEKNVGGSFKRGLVAKISEEELKIIIGGEKYSVYQNESRTYLKPRECGMTVLCIFSGPKNDKFISKIYSPLGDKVYYEKKN